MSNKLPTEKEALEVALGIIDQLVDFAKEGVVPEVTIGTFKTIAIIRKIVG